MSEVISCLDKVKQSTALSSPKLNSTVGEAYPVNDYESLGFQGYNNNTRKKEDITKWANKNHSFAKASICFHLAEIPLKLLSYFYSYNTDKDNQLSKGLFFLERLSDSFGGMFRNLIFGRADDNLGAEKFAQDKFGDSTTYQISTANHYSQTLGRFAIPLIGLLDQKIANDLDWAIAHGLDSIRWKRTASNTAFYPGFLHDLWHSFSSKHPTKLTDIVKAAFNKFKDNVEQAKGSWIALKESSTKSGKLSFYKSMDQVTSSFLALSQWPNMIGDILRPLARRFDLSSTSRNITRTLSVIDRPFIWANYLFRFYLPEKMAEKELEKNNKQGSFNFSHLYTASIAGDILDFTATIFENRIKESSSWIQHSIETIRILKGSFLKLFFSGRRERIGRENLNPDSNLN